jgi:phosphosulfolactate phosphohydrolase-like enzyme
VGTGRRRRDRLTLDVRRRGRRAQLGFGEDVDIAAELDSSPFVPLLLGDAFVRAE